MSDYIKRSLAKAQFTGNSLVSLCKTLIDEVPSADVKEVKHGKWIWLDNDDTTADTFFCSECRTQYITELPDEDPIDFGIRKRDLNYCPNCGARMDLKE